MSSESEAEAEPAVQIVDETKSVTSKSSVGKSPKSLHDTESLQKSQSEGKILKRSDTVKGYSNDFFLNASICMSCLFGFFVPREQEVCIFT